MNHSDVFERFEYCFEDGTKAPAYAVPAAHIGGRAVLIEFLSPADATSRVIKFVSSAFDLAHIEFEKAYTQKQIIHHAVMRFCLGKWGDRLAPAQMGAGRVHVEPILAP
jgi:hypothetical protein